MVQSRRDTIDPALRTRGLAAGEEAGLGRIVLGHFGGIGRGLAARRVVGAVLGSLVLGLVALFFAVGLAVESVPLPVKALFVLLALLCVRGVVSKVRRPFGPRRWWVGLFEDGVVITHDRPRFDVACRWVDVDQVSFAPFLRSDGQGGVGAGGEWLILRFPGRRRPYVLNDLTNDLATLGTRAVQLHNAHCFPSTGGTARGRE